MGQAHWPVPMEAANHPRMNWRLRVSRENMWRALRKSNQPNQSVDRYVSPGAEAGCNQVTPDPARCACRNAALTVFAALARKGSSGTT